MLAFDRRQRGTFTPRASRNTPRTRVIPPRIKRAKALMAEPRALLSRVEQQFGVPKELLMAIWTLETDNGTGDMGKLPVVRTLATLAHDCRRTELFQGELIAALQIVQRGDLPLRDLIGAFAGEIGQTQFLPSSYIKYGVDYRRQRPCRSAPQRAGRAGLDRQSAEGQWLAGRRAVRRGHARISR